MSQTSNEIGLGELITKIKQELASTNKDNPVFLVENVELELQVTVSKENEIKGQSEVKADLKINILGADFFKLGEAKGSVDATKKRKQENIHTIKVTLTPAILNDKFMAKLTPDKRKEVEESTGILVLGSSDQIHIDS